MNIYTHLRLYISSIIILLLCCCSWIGQAQTFNFEERINEGVHTASNIKSHGLLDTIIVRQDRWADMQSSGWQQNLKFKSVNAYVKLYVNHSYANIVSNGYNLRMTYMVYGYNNPADTNNYVLTNDTLTISYKSDSLAQYQDIQARRFSNYHKMMIIVTGLYFVDANGQNPTPVNLTTLTQLNFNVGGQIIVQPYDKKALVNSSYVNAYGSTSTALNITAQAVSGDYMNISWVLNGMTAGTPMQVLPANYELEWTYIDDYKVDPNSGSQSQVSLSDLSYDFHNNSTRVVLDTNFYRIPIIYQRGYIAYRVRMVRPDSVYYQYPIYSNWTAADNGTLSSIAYKQLSGAHEGDSLNWQYTISFAEQGKHKQVLSYYDGLLKNRQSITRLNSLPNYLIGTENVYDYEGRPAISILPTPIKTDAFRYQTNMGINGQTSLPYQAGDFDALDGYACPDEGMLTPLATNALPNQYYSPANPDQSNYNAYIPDAKGYPLVETIHTPGFDDRVKLQGGAGDALQIGQGHYSKNDYVSSDQTDLNRLFGLNIGYAGFYRKTVSKDPNGQLSMTVTDYHGKQVASSLIGVPDTAKLALTKNENVPDTSVYTEDLIAGMPQQIIGNSKIIQKDFYMDVAGNTQFSYSNTVIPFEVCDSPGTYLQAQMRYKYYVANECGQQEIADSGDIGHTGVVSSGDPIVNSYSPQSTAFLPQGSQTVYKKLFIPQDNIYAAVDSYLATPTSCLHDVNYFIREQVESKEFPCDNGNDDDNPCDALKREMMAELWPNANHTYQKRKYGYYQGGAAEAFIYANNWQNNNSIFTQYNINLGGSNGWSPIQPIHSSGDTTTVITDGNTVKFRYQNPCLTLPDSVVYQGKVYHNIASLPVDTFIKIFNDDIAEALLPLHPEYCKLMACRPDTFGNQFKSIPDAATAEAIGLLYLNDIVHADPLYAQLSAAPLSITSALDSLSSFSGLNINTFALQNAYCSSGDTALSSQCMSNIYQNEINNSILINDQVKASYFSKVQTMYLGNRQHYWDMANNSANLPAASCAVCQDMRMTLIPDPVFPPTIIDPNTNTLATGPGSFANEYDSIASAAVGSNVSIEDSVLSQLTGNSFEDSLNNATNIYNGIQQISCTGKVGQIMQKLVNCLPQGNLTAVQTYLENICSNNQMVNGGFTPDQIKTALTSNGISLNDLCNPYLVDYDSLTLGNGAGDMVTCKDDYYYDAVTTVMNQGGIIQALQNLGTPVAVTINGSDDFSQSIISHIGANSQQVTATHNGNLIVLAFQGSGTDLVHITLHNTSGVSLFNAGSNDYFGAIRCITSNNPNFATGMISVYAFNADVIHNSSTYTLPSWTDNIYMATPGSSTLSGCVPCTQMWSLYKNFKQVLDTYQVHGVNHPNYSTMLRSYMNLRLGKNYLSQQYEDFITSCAFADSIRMDMYNGYAKMTFNTDASATTFYNALTALDSVGTPIWWWYKSGGNNEIRIDLASVPYNHYSTVVNFVNNYSGTFVSKSINMVDGGNNLGTTFTNNSISSSFFPVGTISTPNANSLGTVSLWNGNGFDTRNMVQWTTPALTDYKNNQRNVARIDSYMVHSSVAGVYYPSMKHAVDSDYYLPTKQGFLAYNYGMTEQTPSTVLNKLLPSVMQPQVSAFTGLGLDYGQPMYPDKLENLYLTGSNATNGTHYNIISNMINAVSNQTGGYLFTLNAPTQITNTNNYNLRAYHCDDHNYLYRCFSTGDTLYNLFVKMPAYLSVSGWMPYHLDSIKAAPGDGASRTVYLYVHKNGNSHELRLTAFANVTVAHTAYLKNVLLHNGSADGSTLVDTVDNCERDRMNDAIQQGYLTYQIYRDSVKHALYIAFLEHVLNTTTESLTIGYRSQRFNYTLYYYDRAGNLMRTVPPAGVNMLSDNSLTAVDAGRNTNSEDATLIPAHKKASVYEYNSLNKVFHQQTPDGGQTDFFYDAAGRVIFSQNDKQRADSGKYMSYTLYDGQGRIIETGEAPLACKYFVPVPYSDTATSPTLPSGMNCGYFDAITHYILPYNPIIYNAKAYSYDAIRDYVRSFPRRDVVQTIYDTAFVDLSQFDGQSKQLNLRKRVADILYLDNLSAGTVHTNKYRYAMHFSYDIEGNVNILTREYPNWTAFNQRFKRIDYDFDLISGKVNLVSYNRGFADQFYQRYAYDADNRITQVETSNDGYIWKRDAGYEYYKHGPLARMSLGDQRVQGVDYAYTIQGWLKAINGDILSPNQDMGGDDLTGSAGITARDAFNMSVDYFQGDYAPIAGGTVLTSLQPTTKSLYNGNIPRITTGIMPFQTLNKNYQYDQLNRIKSAGYALMTVNNNQYIPSGVSDYATNYSYDPDGNLKKLNRKGPSIGGIAQMMDSLSYSYDASGTNNKLLDVNDYAANVAAYGNNDISQYTVQGTARYQYDGTGNIIKDLVSGQDTIRWNLYGKVSQVHQDAHSRDMYFNYDGAGNRYLKELYTDSATASSEAGEYYVRDAQGNVLAVYKTKGAFSAKKEYWLGVINQALVSQSGTDTAVSNIYNYVSSMSGFDQYFLDMVDQGWLQNYLQQYPVSYYITHNSAVGPNIYNNVGDYMDLLMQHMDYVTNNSGQNVLADAMNNMYTQEPPLAHQLFMAIQQAVDPQMQRFAIGHLGAQEQLAVKTLVDLGEDLGMVSTLDSVGKSDLLWQHLNQDPVGLAESYIHAVSSVGTAAAMAFYQGLTLDQDVLTFPQLTANGQPLQQVYNQALAQYANNSLSGAFFDFLGSTGYDYLFNTNTLSLLGGIVLANNGDSMVSVYVSEQGWNGFNSILAQLDLSPMPYYIGCNGDAGDMANIMSQFINSYTISLAEHDIYGSSRLGTKNYKPGQIYASWNFAQGTYDTLSLMSKRPWYSGTYNNLIDSNVQGSNVISLLSSHTGLRQYELSNHLGNVQATISDEPYLKGTNGTAVAQRSPALAAAYDYYPFGMLMPDRYISDTGSHCVLVNKPQWITTYQTVCYDSLVKHKNWVWSQLQLMGSATSVFLEDGSLQVSLTSPKTDGIKINVNAPIGQAAEVIIPAQNFKGNFIAAVVETVNGVDKVVQQIALTNGASLSINFTPSASSTNSIWIGANTNIAIAPLYTYTIETICITQKVNTQQNVLVNVCDDAGDKYRFGFQKQEKDNEIAGVANHLNFKYRGYDPRTGRFWSVDPIADTFPWNSTYAFSEDRVNDGIELEGREFMPLPLLGVSDVMVEDNPMFESIIRGGGNITEVGKIVGDAVGSVGRTAINVSKAAASDYHPFPMPFSYYDPNYSWIKEAGKLVAKNQRAENLKKGIPESQLGPSGKPKRYSVSKPNNKRAKDASRNNRKSNSNPVKHSSDKGQKTHYHSTRDGEKLEGKDNVHYYDRSTKTNPY